MPPLPEHMAGREPPPPVDATLMRRFDEWLVTAGLPPAECEVRRRAAARAIALGLPGPKDESWRTMDLKERTLGDFLPDPEVARRGPAALPEGAGDADLVFIDGFLVHESKDRARSGPRDLAHPGAPLPAPSDGEDVFRLLNRAAMTHGFDLFLDAGQTHAPVRIRDLSLSRGSHARHRLRLDAGARAVLTVEEESATGLVRNGGIDVRLGEGARLDLVLIQRAGGGAHHLLRVFARLARGARISVRHLVLGSGAARAEQVWDLDGGSARGELAGLLLAPARARLDMAVEIAHRAGEATSEQHVRALVAPTARAAAAGRILVAPTADGTDAHQQLRGLLLAPGAECDFKPELEIEAEDVACSHGAAIGSLDETQLFYLVSRGIDETSARRLLMEAFAAERFTSGGDDDGAAPWIGRAIADGMDALAAMEACDG